MNFELSKWSTMIKSILIVLFCLATVNAFNLTDLIPGRIIDHAKSKSLTIQNENSISAYSQDPLSQTEDVYMNWFNFKLVYHIKRERKLIIEEQNDFFKLKMVYEPSYPNVFILHGWLSQYGVDKWLDQYKDMIFKANNEKVNVFIVDWYEFAKSINYYRSAKFTKVLGAQLAKFIFYLKDRLSIDPNNIHMIGHSLGAHAAGFTGKALKKKFNIEIGKITGLDPAGLGFLTSKIDERLDKSDAQFVEVLHTNMGSYCTGLGIALKIGHVDIFLNGGSKQSGCTALMRDTNHDNYCSISNLQNNQVDYPIDNRLNPMISLIDTKIFYCHHARAYEFYMESPEFRDPCQAVAYECSSYKDYLMGKCSSCGEQNQNCHVFGYYPNDNINSSVNTNGKSYFLRTNEKSPLCTNHYQVEIKYTSSNFEYGEFEITLDGQKGSLVEIVKGQWNHFANGLFSSVIITPNNLGKLFRATGRFLREKSWTFRSSKERFVNLNSMSFNYMSNINSTIRDSLSAKFDCRYLGGQYSCLTSK